MKYEITLTLASAGFIGLAEAQKAAGKVSLEAIKQETGGK